MVEGSPKSDLEQLYETLADRKHKRFLAIVLLVAGIGVAALSIVVAYFGAWKVAYLVIATISAGMMWEAITGLISHNRDIHLIERSIKDKEWPRRSVGGKGN